MVDLTQNSEIAVALIAGMDYARIEFKRGQIPDSPVSDCDSLNQLWYSPEIVLCQNLEEIINFANLAARDFFGRGVLGTPSIELVPNRTDLRAARAEVFKRILATGAPEYFDNSPRIDETGNEVPVNVWAFRYYLNRNPSVGAKLDSSTTK